MKTTFVLSENDKPLLVGDFLELAAIANGMFGVTVRPATQRYDQPGLRGDSWSLIGAKQFQQ